MQNFSMNAKGFEKVGDVTIPDLFVKPSDNAFPLKVGTDIFIDSPDAEPSNRISFNFSVAFGESNIIDGEPIVPTLIEFAQMIDDIVIELRPHL